MPLYCIVHLSSSPEASERRSKKEESLQVDASFRKLPLAMALGYILPTVLMSVPLHKLLTSLPANVIHQWFTGLWQGAPVWVFLFHLILEKGKTASPPLTQAISIAKRQKQQIGLDQTQLFALACAMFTQLCTFGILISRNLLPLSPGTRRELTFTTVFVPPRPWAVRQMPNMAIGIMNFFQYDQYVGSLAGLLWSMMLHRRSTTTEVPLGIWILRIVQRCAIGIVAGPTAVIMNIILDRDRLLAESSTNH